MISVGNVPLKLAASAVLGAPAIAHLPEGLTAEPRSSDALDLTEVTGKKNIDGDGAPRNARGTLGIVEAELYGPSPSP